MTVSIQGEVRPLDGAFVVSVVRLASQYKFDEALDAVEEIDNHRWRSGARAVVVKHMARARSYAVARGEAGKISHPLYRTLAHLSIAAVSRSLRDFGEALASAETVEGPERNTVYLEIASSLAEAQCFQAARAAAGKIRDREKSDAALRLIDKEKRRSFLRRRR